MTKELVDFVIGDEVLDDLIDIESIFGVGKTEDPKPEPTPVQPPPPASPTIRLPAYVKDLNKLLEASKMKLEEKTLGPKKTAAAKFNASVSCAVDKHQRTGKPMAFLKSLNAKKQEKVATVTVKAPTQQVKQERRPPAKIKKPSSHTKQPTQRKVPAPKERQRMRPEVPIRRTSPPIHPGLVHSELSFLNNSPFQMNPKLQSFKIPKLKSDLKSK
ncbi:hypothetical protein CHUAL_005927 [Chamberlinius hualienensis]